MRAAVAFTCIPLAAAWVSAHVAPFGITTAILVPFAVMAFPGMLFVRPRDGIGWAYWMTVSFCSTGILVGAIVLTRIAGLRMTTWGAWAFLAALTGVAWVVRRGHLMDLPARIHDALAAMPRWKAFLALAGLVFSHVSARWVVPPQQDQDMVIANPVYGYLQHGRPYGTETHFAYIFSKPPLLHLQAGATLLLIDRLEQASFYWQSGRIVELLGAPQWASRLYRRRDIESFELHPELIAGTRLLTTFYAAFAPVAIADLAVGLGGSPTAAVVTGLSYLFIPENFVRYGYAGFTTPSTVLLAVAALLVLGAAPGAARFHAGALMALLNHKVLFVPAVYAVWRAAGFRGGGIRRTLRDPWLWGVAAGTAVWWAYGATVDWSTFLRDHFYYDFRHRFLLQDLSLGGVGPGWYPGVGGLWREWARNLSPPLLALGIVGVAWGLTRPGPTRFLALWALAGWFLGSVTDWRQTKHLMLTIVPMAVTAQLAAERAGRWRCLVVAALMAAALHNGVRIVNLWRDFDSLRPSTIW